MPRWCATSLRATASCSRCATNSRTGSTPGTASSAGKPVEPAGYERFLREIGYLRPEPAGLPIRTENVDDEIARIAGPQLVVPVSNARYALNAANARWGILYDALYGTDAIPEDGGAERGRGFNKERGERVVARAKEFLDEAAPLAGAATRTRRPMRSRTGSSSSRSPDGGRTGLKRPDRSSSATGARPATLGGAAAPQRPAHRDRDRPPEPDRRATTRPASPT